MTKEILHVGVTVSDMEKSLGFYRDILGLQVTGELFMEGKETDLLFGRKNTRAKVVYLKGTEELVSPPVELIQFVGTALTPRKADLFSPSVSEICFRVADMDKFYRHLQENGVECLSSPQDFDFTDFGFGKSRAIYFRDPDNIILEAIQ